MNESSPTDLDAQELLHLALKAMEESRDAEAIGFLKRCIALAPEEGRAHYLLGAIHAQIGMYERALEELQTAVRLAPEIDMAHFQLGLLHLTAGQVDAAVEAWETLDRLGEDDPMRLFVAGMMQLIQERYDDAIALLSEGIARNQDHEALNRDMQRVIDTAIKAREEAAAATASTAATAPAAPSASQHALLSGYHLPTG